MQLLLLTPPTPHPVSTKLIYQRVPEERGEHGTRRCTACPGHQWDRCRGAARSMHTYEKKLVSQSIKGISPALTHTWCVRPKQRSTCLPNVVLLSHSQCKSASVLYRFCATAEAPTPHLYTTARGQENTRVTEHIHQTLTMGLECYEQIHSETDEFMISVLKHHHMHVWTLDRVFLTATVR